MEPQKKKTSVLKVVITLVGVLLIVWYFFGGGLEGQVKNDIQKIENQVAADAEKQYEIAKNSGSDMDAYVQAGMVKAAYLQANDQVNYKKWVEIEKEHGKKIGL